MRITAPSGPVTLTGHGRDAIGSATIGGRTARELPVEGDAQRTFAVGGSSTGGRILVVSEVDARQRLTAFDLDGTRLSSFASNGQLVAPADRYIAGVVERPSGGLVIWLETPDFSDDVHELLLTTAGGGSPTLVAVDPAVLSDSPAMAVLPSGDAHVLAFTRQDPYGFETRVDRITLADGEADPDFTWDDTWSPEFVADLGGELLAVHATGVARLYSTTGAKVSTFGSDGEEDLSGLLSTVTSIGVAPDDRVVLGGYVASSPKTEVGAAMLGAGGLVTSTGQAGLFGGFATDDGLESLVGLTTGEVVLVQEVGGTNNFGRALVFGPTGTLATDCGPLDQPQVLRRSGSDRYGTAAALVSEAVDRADTVLLATGTDFPDALAGGAAAAALDAPLLLVTRDAIPTPTIQQLERLRPSRVVVLGGPKSVGDVVVTGLQQLSWAPTVDRVSGPDRFATALAVSREVFQPGVGRVYLATGHGFADALAAVPAAAFDRGPILLVSGGVLTSELAEELDRLAPLNGVAIAGGPTAVPYDIESALYERGYSVTRYEGRDRFGTAASIAEVLPHWTGAAFLATGSGFADALAAGPIAGRRAAPLLLTSGTSLVEPARNAMAKRSAQVIYVAGGPLTVADEVLKRLDAATLGYSIIEYADAANTTPLRWDACQPIPWRWYRGESPDSDLEFLKDGLASVTSQTGARFTYLGTTSVRPTEAGAEADTNVIVGFEGIFEAGLAGPQVARGSSTYTGGHVAINSHLSGSTFDGTSFASQVVIHEVGHVLGLEHVRSPLQLMTEGLVDEELTTALYQKGDLAGFARTLDFSGCR